MSKEEEVREKEVVDWNLRVDVLNVMTKLNVIDYYYAYMVVSEEGEV